MQCCLCNEGGVCDSGQQTGGTRPPAWTRAPGVCRAWRSTARARSRFWTVRGLKARGSAGEPACGESRPGPCVGPAARQPRCCGARAGLAFRRACVRAAPGVRACGPRRACVRVAPGVRACVRPQACGFSLQTYSQLAHPIQQARALGLQFHSRILDIDSVDVSVSPGGCARHRGAPSLQES